MNQNKRKGLKNKNGKQNMRCPNCSRPMVYRSADGIYKENKNGTYLYVCSNYPECDTYVRVHPGTKIPMGTPANQKVRALRIEAHRHFDLLHQTGIMSKSEAYNWLAYILQAPLSQAHIGYLSEYYCRQVIEESKKMLANRRRIISFPNPVPVRGGVIHAVK